MRNFCIIAHIESIESNAQLEDAKAPYYLSMRLKESKLKLWQTYFAHNLESWWKRFVNYLLIFEEKMVNSEGDGEILRESVGKI